jgi:hypothetical protein
MNEKQEKWLTIIPPMPASEFEAFVKRWRDENKDVLEGIDSERFAVDVIRTKDGQTHRRLRMLLP